MSSLLNLSLAAWSLESKLIEQRSSCDKYPVCFSDFDVRILLMGEGIPGPSVNVRFGC